MCLVRLVDTAKHRSHTLHLYGFFTRMNAHVLFKIWLPEKNTDHTLCISMAFHQSECACGV